MVSALTMSRIFSMVTPIKPWIGCSAIRNSSFYNTKIVYEFLTAGCSCGSFHSRQSSRKSNQSSTPVPMDTRKEILRSPVRSPVKSGSSQRRSLCKRMYCCINASRLFSAAISAPYSSAVVLASSAVTVQSTSRCCTRTVRSRRRPSQPVCPSIHFAKAIGSSESSRIAASMWSEMPNGRPPLLFCAGGEVLPVEYLLLRCNHRP